MAEYDESDYAGKNLNEPAGSGWGWLWGLFLALLVALGFSWAFGLGKAPAPGKAPETTTTMPAKPSATISTAALHDSLGKDISFTGKIDRMIGDNAAVVSGSDGKEILVVFKEPVAQPVTAADSQVRIDGTVHEFAKLQEKNIQLNLSDADRAQFEKLPIIVAKAIVPVKPASEVKPEAKPEAQPVTPPTAKPEAKPETAPEVSKPTSTDTVLEKSPPAPTAQ